MQTVLQFRHRTLLDQLPSLSSDVRFASVFLVAQPVILTIASGADTTTSQSERLCAACEPWRAIPMKTPGVQTTTSKVADPDALNFNPEATADDGSCVASNWSYGEPWTYLHAYETIQMGNQCGLQRTCETPLFADGTSISQPGSAGWVDNQENGGNTCLHRIRHGRIPLRLGRSDFELGKRWR